MFKQLFKHKQVFIGFITGGDGGIDYTVDCCLNMIAGGVDILEIGFPFSDPVADGPVIQQSSKRALASGANSATLLEIARRIRQHTTIPLVLFTYFNPLLQLGTEFLHQAKAAGYDAVLIVDLPAPTDNQTSYFFKEINLAGLQPVFLASPSTDDTRLEKIASIADSFIYYACQKGTTGVKKNIPTDLGINISRIRNKTSLPIVTGFGIADNNSAREALIYSDGFVVGSAFVNLMAQKTNPFELQLLAKSIDPRHA